LIPLLLDALPRGFQVGFLFSEEEAALFFNPLRPKASFSAARGRVGDFFFWAAREVFLPFWGGGPVRLGCEHSLVPLAFFPFCFARRLSRRLVLRKGVDHIFFFEVNPFRKGVLQLNNCLFIQVTSHFLPLKEYFSLFPLHTPLPPFFFGFSEGSFAGMNASLLPFFSGCRLLFFLVFLSFFREMFFPIRSNNPLGFL